MKFPFELVVYRLTNLQNGKIYIGRTVRGPYQRWKYNHHSDMPYRAGNTEFDWSLEVVQRCETIEELCHAEWNWIQNIQPECKEPTGYNAGNGCWWNPEQSIKYMKKRNCYREFQEVGNQTISPLFTNLLTTEYYYNPESGLCHKSTRVNTRRMMEVRLRSKATP